MKITTFNPQIITKDMEPVIKLFEKLGFEKAHKKEGVGEYDVTGIQMRDPNGFKLDISQADFLPVDSVVSIRMNVDDFDEACLSREASKTSTATRQRIHRPQSRQL